MIRFILFNYSMIRQTKDGRYIKVCDMTTEHIKNTISYLKRVGLRYHGLVRDYDSLVQDYEEYYYDGPDKERDKEYIKAFEEELRLRGELR